MRPQERRIKDPDIFPGMKMMLELGVKQARGLRPPPAVRVAEALKIFFHSKLERKALVTDTEANYAMRTLDYLLENQPPDDSPPWLSAVDLHAGLQTLAESLHTTSLTGQHVALSRSLFALCIALDVEDSYRETPAATVSARIAYLRILSKTGHTAEAEQISKKYFLQVRGTVTNRENRQIWKLLLQGYVKERDEKQFLRCVGLIKEDGFPFTLSEISILAIRLYTTLGNLGQTKEWYDRLIAEGDTADAEEVHELVKLSIAQKDPEWGRKVVHKALEGNPSKRAWDAILLWAASTGKGVEELDKMREVMERRNPDDSSCRVDVETLNSLVESAVTRNDPYLMERYVSLGARWGIQPNATTYILQMHSRLSVDDVEGARESYQRLQTEDVVDDEDVEIVNKLIQAMCRTDRYEFDTIAAVVENLNERKARLEAETVAALCLIHLDREEYHDLIDLLQTHSFHYSIYQRIVVQSVFVEYCLNRRNSVARVWDAYVILQQIFNEVDRPTRLRIMSMFFTRKRPDMAVHAFNHLREHLSEDVRADADTYVAVLVGIGGAGDEESLEIVHNQLKLDTSVEPNTRLHNALMLAYIGCHDAGRALGFWTDIANSFEGPSHNSILIAFRACETASFGRQQAKIIWSKLREMDLEISKDILAAYIGAHAASGSMQEAAELVDQAEQFGFPVDTRM